MSAAETSSTSYSRIKLYSILQTHHSDRCWLKPISDKVTKLIPVFKNGIGKVSKAMH